jgi:CDGSH-type Zn-finger protein/mannose-6-phosphate isomerase-like protein (cupin superfamily)
MTKPQIPSRKGFYFELKAGECYRWCSCGRSKRQPFCDGSHAGTSFAPVRFEAQSDEEVILCGCKHTATPPFCDGSHSNLTGGSEADDPESSENQRVNWAEPGAGPMLRLDGGCYVFSTARAQLRAAGSLRYCAIVTPANGALFQSQFYVEITRASSPVISADGRHTVLFVSAGAGEIEISGRHFPLAPLTGVYVRPGETYRIESRERLEVYISNAPGSLDLLWVERMQNAFDQAHPHRCASVEPAQRHKMAERHYQLLVCREQGSRVLTQFIGNIPLSKAQPHRHLYEEALIFLNGAGTVWTQSTKARVGAGDVVFLPRKQLHSVQCSTPGGFDVVGVICPGDNPAINY